ncbi:MAG: transposon-encoded TnpW family protein [Blautia massiliensis (ex Durand et al. 2017)]|uniref:transposon-encoded TnpW family protein n=1 Tax=Blautia massiliensis (ex Durand et al. 2017) TaxID=1737424 RepID=UPI00399D050B
MPGDSRKGKNDEYKNRGNTFTKKIGQTVYVVRYHFNEDAKETLQEKNCESLK